MFKTMKFLYTLLLGSLLLWTGCQSPHIKVEHMSVEMLENPVGVGTPTPRFSWQLTAAVPDVMQTFYRIQVATSEKALLSGDLLWDSGEVPSDLSILIPYQGPALESERITSGGSTYRQTSTPKPGAPPPTGPWPCSLLRIGRPNGSASPPKTRP